MATVYLGRSDKEFWDMTPRTLISMIDQWNLIEKAQAKMKGLVFASYMNGKDPDEFLTVKKPEKVQKHSREQLERNARMLF